MRDILQSRYLRSNVAHKQLARTSLMLLSRYFHQGQIPLGRCFHHGVLLHLKVSFSSAYVGSVQLFDS